MNRHILAEGARSRVAEHGRHQPPGWDRGPLQADTMRRDSAERI
jgi:hypothetical protein